MKKLEAVFFDIDDTLYSTTEFTKKARLNAIDEMIRVGLDIDRGACYEILQEIIKEFTSNDSHHFNKLIHRLPAEAKSEINELLTIAAGVSGYHNTKFVDLKPFPDVKQYLPLIAEFSPLTGVISSGLGLKQAEKLIRLDVQEYFDTGAIFITDEVGIGKNNPKLFEHACRQTGRSPEHCIHVGDNPSTDVDTAHEAGLITVLRTGSGKHANDPGLHDPDYTISDLGRLYSLVQSEFKPVR